MNRYEKGFLTKCAEAGVPQNVAIGLLNKKAQEMINAGRVARNSSGAGAAIGTGLLGGLAGAGIGALFPGRDEEGRTHRAKNAVRGALLGLLGGGGLGYLGGYMSTKNILNHGAIPDMIPNTEAAADEWAKKFVDATKSYYGQKPGTSGGASSGAASGGSSSGF